MATFTPGWRRLFLALHVVTSVAFPGAIAAFLALAIVGATARDDAVARASYVAMAPLTWVVVIPLALTSLVVGVVQSLGTPWGLIRYYWIIVKLVLTVVAVTVLLVQTQTINALAGAALGNGLAEMRTAQSAMILHSAGGLLVVLVAALLSIYKPRGLTPWGVRQQAGV